MTSRNGKTDKKIANDKDDVVRAIPLACADEAAAVELFEALRWGDSPGCPRCGDMDVYKMTQRGSDERNERFLWRCRGCKRQYTVRIGTVMEDSPIPLRHWAFAFWRACTSKKGVSALEIKRQTGLTYKSALFLMHRIRYAMLGAGDSGGKLSGDVEVDETFVGGKPRKRAAFDPTTGERKRGPAPDFKDRKTPVVALIERGGDVRARVVTSVTAANLKGAIREHVDPTARILTDERRGYVGIGDEYEGGHEAVKHPGGEYVRGDVHVNSCESFFAILKRGVYGIWHNVSPEHLHRYVASAEFRYNTRGVSDGERVKRAIIGAEGKRITYRPVTG